MEALTDTERQLLLDLVLREMAELPVTADASTDAGYQMLVGLLRKISPEANKPMKRNRLITAEEAGQRGVLPPLPERASAYQDDSYPERACDHCGKLYRGPAVCCSLSCAIADA